MIRSALYGPLSTVPSTHSDSGPEGGALMPTAGAPGLPLLPIPIRTLSRVEWIATLPTPRPAFTLAPRSEEPVRLPLRTVPLPPPETGAEAVELMLRAGLRCAPLFGKFLRTGDNVRLGAPPAPVIGKNRGNRSGLDPFLSLFEALWLGASGFSAFLRSFPAALTSEPGAPEAGADEPGSLIVKLAMCPSNPLNAISHSSRQQFLILISPSDGAG